MSVTNPERVVTKQDLADFYGQILPYLGSRTSPIASTFSKGDLYSTDEKMIGQYIDGKPLYQKVLTDTFPTVTTDGTYATKETAHNIANVDTIFVVGGYFIAANIARTIPYLTNKGYQAKCGVNGTILQLLSGTKDFNNAPVVIVVQYTKTTDFAISIGSDTDYSTDEKIIGTWLDGSPIYQKTIQETMPNASTLGTLVKKYVDVGVNVSHFINVSGFISVDSGAQTIDSVDMPINVVNGTSFSLVRGIPNSGANGYKNKIEIGNATPVWNGDTVYITIQYIKTT